MAQSRTLNFSGTRSFSWTSRRASTSPRAPKLGAGPGGEALKFIGDHDMEGNHQWGYPKNAGWFYTCLYWKITLKWMMTGGSPVLGKLHVEPSTCHEFDGNASTFGKTMKNPLETKEWTPAQCAETGLCSDYTAISKFAQVV